MKNEVLISYLQSLFPTYQCKAEFSTNDDDKKVIVVQEQPGQKICESFGQHALEAAAIGVGGPCMRGGGEITLEHEFVAVSRERNHGGEKHCRNVIARRHI